MARKNPFLGRVIYRALYRAIQTLDGADTDAVTALTDLIARDAAYLTDAQMAALALAIEAKVPVDEDIEDAAEELVAGTESEPESTTTETPTESKQPETEETTESKQPETEETTEPETEQPTDATETGVQK